MRSREGGFTLFETMIALVIISIVLSSFSFAVGHLAKNQSELEYRMNGLWVANEALTNLFIPNQEMKTEAVILNEDWRIEISSSKSDIPGMKQFKAKAKMKGVNVSIHSKTVAQWN